MPRKLIAKQKKAIEAVLDNDSTVTGDTFPSKEYLEIRDMNHWESFYYYFKGYIRDYKTKQHQALQNKINGR